MNILFVTSDNNTASGAFLSMVRLASILKYQHKHNVYVILPKEGNGQELLKEQGIPFYVVRSYNWIVRMSDSKKAKTRIENNVKRVLNIRAVWESAHLIKKLKIDIVHINTSWTYVGVLAATKCSVPVIWHIREFLEEDQNVMIWNREKGYELMKSAKHIVTISDSIYQKYYKILDKNKMVTILNGIDETIFYSPNHSIFRDEQYKFLIVGTISESKGQIQLINACKCLKEKGYSNFKVQIVGRGKDDYVDALKQKVKVYDLGSIIDFCGYHSHVADYYKTADVTFVCSKAEAFGRVTVEAMLGGSLVIGANTAATIELIDDKKTGLLYECESDSDLADQIEWVMNHKEEASSIARKGQQYMLDNMTAKINAQKINSIYKKIMNE